MAAPTERIVFFVVRRQTYEMVCDCEGAKAVFIQVEPGNSSSQENHSAEDMPETEVINLTLKGLDRRTLIRINTAYDDQPDAG
jgi:hypothetical protein